MNKCIVCEKEMPSDQPQALTSCVGCRADLHIELLKLERDAAKQGLHAERETRMQAIGVLRWIAQQPCSNHACTSTETANQPPDERGCTKTSMCITEYCLPCFAWTQLKRMERPDGNLQLFEVHFDGYVVWYAAENEEQVRQMFKREWGTEEEPEVDSIGAIAKEKTLTLGDGVIIKASDFAEPGMAAVCQDLA